MSDPASFSQPPEEGLLSFRYPVLKNKGDCRLEIPQGHLACSLGWATLPGVCFDLPVLSIPELNLSSGCLQLEYRRREFTSSGTRKLYFDTHALVCLLEGNGNPSPPLSALEDHSEQWPLGSIHFHMFLFNSSLQVTFPSISFLGHCFCCCCCWRTFLLHQYNGDFLCIFSLTRWSEFL